MFKLNDKTFRSASAVRGHILNQSPWIYWGGRLSLEALEREGKQLVIIKLNPTSRSMNQEPQQVGAIECAGIPHRHNLVEILGEALPLPR